jgi:GntR family galactonate operon transcriptional repressor
MIARESLHDKVVRHLALKIVAGDLTTLPNEADLGKELSVSRSILRESIKVLAAKGLVHVGPTGTKVRPRREWNLFDPRLLEWISENGKDKHFFENLCELRLAFEPKAAELAAQRATADDIVEIRDAWQEMRSSSKDRLAYSQADLRFHEAVLKACHNELFIQVAGLTKIYLRMSFLITSSAYARFSASLLKHKRVLDAIVARDGAAASKHMEKVIGVATRQIKTVAGG